MSTIDPIQGAIELHVPTIAGNISEDGLSGFLHFQIPGAARDGPTQIPSARTGDSAGHNGAVIGWVVLAVLLGLLYFWVGSNAKDDGPDTPPPPAATNRPNTEVKVHSSKPQEIAKPQETPPVKTERKQVKKMVDQRSPEALRIMPKNREAQAENFEHLEAETQDDSVDLDAIRRFKSKM